MPAVIGLKELEKAFAIAGTEFQKERRTRLRGMAEPVRVDAQVLALSHGVGADWSRMRTGATPTLAYVAPVNRGTRIVPRKRRNFPRFILSRAMEPALARNAPRIVRQFEQMLARMERAWARG